ncbi:MAG: hypothetical protein IKK75_12110 [Clostridia bacterium]|nr:hypothetical protein [Clostridia bacterium]
MKSRKGYLLKMFLTILVLPLFAVCYAEENKLNNLTMHAESFDYSFALDWGLNGCDDLMSAQTDVQEEHLDQWMKCWIRIWIKPGVDRAVQYGADDMNPLSYVDMSIQNVRIRNAQEIGVYPQNDMMFAANPAIFSEDTTKIDGNDGDLWYLEVLIDVRNREPEQIEKAIQQAEVFCDVYQAGEAQTYVKKDVRIPLDHVKRRVLFDNKAIQAYATMFEKSTVDPFTIFENYPVSDDLLLELEEDPASFQCYKLALVLQNNSPYHILAIDRFPAQIQENVWLAYYELEFSGVMGCKSGAETVLTDYYLIVKENTEGIDVENWSQQIPLRLEVYTEFAGIICEDDGEGTIGRLGIPLPVLIDKSTLVHAE